MGASVLIGLGQSDFCRAVLGLGRFGVCSARPLTVYGGSPRAGPPNHTAPRPPQPRCGCACPLAPTPPNLPSEQGLAHLRHPVLAGEAHRRRRIRESLRESQPRRPGGQTPLQNSIYRLFNLQQGSEACRRRLFRRREVSGCQGQRVAVSRGLGREDPLIVLEEPTACLGAKAEADVCRRFAAMAGGRTALLVSHRLGSARVCDRVLVLDGGWLVEQGAHQELLERGGHYERLWALRGQRSGRAGRGTADRAPERLLPTPACVTGPRAPRAGTCRFRAVGGCPSRPALVPAGTRGVSGAAGARCIPPARRTTGRAFRPVALGGPEAGGRPPAPFLRTEWPASDRKTRPTSSEIGGRHGPKRNPPAGAPGCRLRSGWRVAAGGVAVESRDRCRGPHGRTTAIAAAWRTPPCPARLSVGGFLRPAKRVGPVAWGGMPPSTDPPPTCAGCAGEPRCFPTGIRWWCRTQRAPVYKAEREIRERVILGLLRRVRSQPGRRPRFSAWRLRLPRPPAAPQGARSIRTGRPAQGR